MQPPGSSEALVQSGPFVSVVICTYGRSAALRDVLNSLCAQTYSNFEILVVDGNGEVSPARDIVSEFMNSAAACLDLSLIRSEKGLTRQRNVGLRTAKGDLICFLDDDVTFEEDFLAKSVSLFKTPGMETVGGITPYDSLNYSAPVTLRWRLRALFGVMPSLNPGEVDRLGRAVPLSFLKPWPGRKEIGWLPGFCMIYRRVAVEGVTFDEGLPTYGGEDRDFSMRVGEHWRLLICGDLFVRHEYTTQGRESSLDRLRQSSFGAGRRFAKYSRSFRDYLTVAVTVLGDLLIDLIAIARKPVRDNFATLFLRISAFFAGLKSVKAMQPYVHDRCADSVLRIR